MKFQRAFLSTSIASCWNRTAAQMRIKLKFLLRQNDSLISKYYYYYQLCSAACARYCHAKFVQQLVCLYVSYFVDYMTANQPNSLRSVLSYQNIASKRTPRQSYRFSRNRCVFHLSLLWLLPPKFALWNSYAIVGGAVGRNLERF